jgi:hypothetical protein
MSQIDIRCPSCSARFSVSTTLLGRRFLCTCKKSFDITPTTPAQRTSPEVNHLALQIKAQQANEEQVKSAVLRIAVTTALLLAGVAFMIALIVNLALWRRDSLRAREVLAESRAMTERRIADDRAREEEQRKAEEAKRVTEERRRREAEERTRRAQEEEVVRAKAVRAASLDSLKEAAACIRALRKLEAHIEMGISKVEFSNELGDTWSEAKSFLNSRAILGSPDLARGIHAAMKNFAEVQDLWEEAFQGGGLDQKVPLHGTTYRTELQTLFEKCKQDMQKLEGVISNIKQ